MLDRYLKSYLNKEFNRQVDVTISRLMFFFHVYGKLYILTSCLELNVSINTTRRPDVKGQANQAFGYIDEQQKNCRRQRKSVLSKTGSGKFLINYLKKYTLSFIKINVYLSIYLLSVY